MYATSNSMEGVVKSAQGAGNSYNALTHRMAALKEEFRSTEDVVRRAELGQQINRINQELKDLDALKGDFQRNVGDYTNSLKAAFEGAELSSTALGKSIKNVDAASKLMAKNPVIGVVTLLLPVISKVAEKLKENGTAMDALNKIMASMQPIMDVTTKVIEKLAQAFAWLADKVSGLLNKLFKKGKDSLPSAVEESKDAVESMSDSFTNTSRSIDKMAQSVESLQETVNEFTVENILKQLENVDSAVQKSIEERKKWEESTTKLSDDQYKEDYDAIGAWIEAELEMERKAEEEKREEAEKTKQAKIASMYALADTTSSILSSIADMYESDTEETQKNANKVKALRIASATIDTISGAIGAFMQASETIPPPLGQIVGAASAASVTAAGIANIAKMRSTNISSSSSAPTISAISSAPEVSTSMQSVRNITSASEEDRLNQMASDQRVVLVMSDLEVKQNQIKVQARESSF